MRRKILITTEGDLKDKKKVVKRRPKELTEEEKENEKKKEETESDVTDLEESELDTNDYEHDSTQISDDEQEDESSDDESAPITKTESSISSNQESKSRLNLSYLLILVPIIAILITNSLDILKPKKIVDEKERDIQLNLAHVNELDRRYPQILSSKKMRIIKTRLAVMRKEVSILMLLGKSKDVECQSDPTYCIGQTIANVTQVQYGYIDASNPRIKSQEIEQELTSSLDGNKHAVMIDSLEKLPGSQVMNLFQYIDKDETHRRKGMLLFVVYTGVDKLNNDQLTKMRDAEVAERILLDKWSTSIPMDSLTSVISRICGSIVRIY